VDCRFDGTPAYFIVEQWNYLKIESSNYRINYLYHFNKVEMKREKIADVLTNGQVGNDVLVKGWVRSFRANRFVAINDGSTIKNIQAVVDFENFDESLLKRITTASSVAVSGKIVASQGAGQAIEIAV